MVQGVRCLWCVVTARRACVCSLVLVLGTLPLTLPLTALDATLHCSGTHALARRQPARAQRSTAQHQHRRKLSSHGGEKEKSQELAIPDLAFAFHHSSLPSIRAHSRPKPLCKAWPADAFLPPPIIEAKQDCSSVITLKSPRSKTPYSARRSFLSQTAGIGTPIFPVPLRLENCPSRDT